MQFLLVLLAALAPQDPGDATPDVIAPTLGRDWPAWRGPHHTGVAPDADPPVEWSEEHNVRWKIAIPGLGHATPVVWDDRLFLLTAVSVGPVFEAALETAPGAHDNAPVTQARSFEALAVRRSDGEVLWRRALLEEVPHERAHVTGSFASASPVTDGEHLFACFGSRGLFCLDLDGRVMWEKDLGDMQTKHGHGEGSSPALYGDTLVVNWDHEAQSFLAALDKETGEERWRVERDEVTSWGSPIVIEVDGAPQVVVAGTTALRGYDLASGEVVWECGGLSHNVVATPVWADGVLVAGSSYEKQAMIGLRLAGAKGDLAETEHVLWYRRRGTAYVPSPLLVDGWVYFVHHLGGFLSRVEAATGREPLRPLRLRRTGQVFASPIAAAGRVYLADRDGTTVVFSHTEYPQVLAWNRLDDGFSASPVAVGEELYLRGEQFLYCIVEEPEQDGE